jgi:anti-sigma factor RsiW
MVQVPDKFIMAYADGQLSDEERVWLEGLLSSDPQLRQRLAPFLATGPDQWGAFDVVMNAPVPDRLLETIRLAGTAGALSQTGTAARRKTSHSETTGPLQRLVDRIFPSGFGLQPAFGYAATLLVGIGAGLAASGLMDGTSSDDVLLKADRTGFVASGRLLSALEKTPSGKAPAVEGAIQPVLSLRDQDGRFCRQYEILSKRMDGPKGLACREANGDWRITVLTGGPETSPIARPASQEDQTHGSFGTMVDAAVKSLPGHDELSAAEELFLIEKGWGVAPAIGSQPSAD